MSKRGEWGPMTDRVHRGAEPPASAPLPPATVKHCWVTDANGRLPALLLDWRRVADHYQGRVVRLVYEDDAWIVIEEWLAATMLEKA